MINLGIIIRMQKIKKDYRSWILSSQRKENFRKIRMHLINIEISGLNLSMSMISAEQV